VIVLYRSAYVLFVRDAMQKSKISDFAGSKDRLKAFAHSWSTLNAEGKEKYKHLLDREWQQYRRDVEEFKKVYVLHSNLYLLCGVCFQRCILLETGYSCC